jgi:hypothetical protein
MNFVKINLLAGKPCQEMTCGCEDCVRFRVTCSCVADPVQGRVTELLLL